MSTSELAGDPGREEREQIALEARRRAKLARGLGPAHRGDLTPAQIALRNAAIVASSHAGMDAREIAREFLITPRSVERILQEHQRIRTPLEAAPVEILERLMRSYESQIQRYARVAVDTLERAPAVAIAALKGEADTLERYRMLLEDVGKLPDNLELFRSESEMRRVSEEMLDKLQEFSAGDVSVGDVIEFFAELVRPRQVAWEVPAADVRELDAGGG